MKKRETALARHSHNIWQGSDGNWYTYVPDDTKPKNRRKVKNKNRDSLIEYLVFFYTENETQAYVKPNVTFAEAYKLWQEYCRDVHNVTDRTIDKRDCDYRRFIQDTELDSLPIARLIKPSENSVMIWGFSLVAAINSEKPIAVTCLKLTYLPRSYRIRCAIRVFRQHRIIITIQPRVKMQLYKSYRIRLGDVRFPL